MNRISRVGNSVFFLDRVWNEFYYFHKTSHVVDYFEINPLTYQEYEKANPLNTFLNDFYEDYRKYLISAKYKIFYEKYKITPSNFKKVFNAIMLEIWSVKPYLSNFCYNYKGCIDTDSVLHLHKILHLLKETEQSNKTQITPFVFYTGLAEKELKEIFDKYWENILKNSKTRNLLICKKIFNKRNLIGGDMLESSIYPYFGNISKNKLKEISKTEIVDKFNDWNKLKSCALKVSIFSKIWCIPKHEFAVTCIIDNLFGIKNLDKVTNDTNSRKLISEIINFLYRNCRYQNIEEKYLKYSIDEWLRLIEGKVINATF